MKLLLKILVSSVAVYLAGKITPGIEIESFRTALIFAIVLGVFNVLVKPLLLILTLPVNILTLGLFTFVINSIIIIWVSSIVTGVMVTSFFSAFLFSIVLAIVSWLLHIFVR